MGKKPRKDFLSIFNRRSLGVLKKSVVIIKNGTTKYASQNGLFSLTKRKRAEYRLVNIFLFLNGHFH